jgi:hypothetical protein
MLRFFMAFLCVDTMRKEPFRTYGSRHNSINISMVTALIKMELMFSNICEQFQSQFYKKDNEFQEVNWNHRKQEFQSEDIH